MPVYKYDHALTAQENRKRAVVLHEQDGPMVPVLVAAGGDTFTSHWLFPDGAYLDNYPHAGVMEPTEAPPRPGWEHLSYGDQYRATLRRRRDYWRIRVERAVAQFAGLKKRALAHANPSADLVDELRALQAEVLACRARLKDAEEEITPPVEPPPPPTAEQRAAFACREQARADLLADIQAVEV